MGTIRGDISDRRSRGVERDSLHAVRILCERRSGVRDEMRMKKEMHCDFKYPKFECEECSHPNDGF